MARFKLWPIIDAGSLRTPVILLPPVPAADASGAVTTYPVPPNPVTLMCSVDWIRGIDQLKSGQDITQSYCAVTTWYTPAVTAQCRLQLPDGSQLIIQHVNDIESKHVKLELTCLRIGS